MLGAVYFNWEITFQREGSMYVHIQNVVIYLTWTDHYYLLHSYLCKNPRVFPIYVACTPVLTRWYRHAMGEAILRGKDVFIFPMFQEVPLHQADGQINPSYCNRCWQCAFVAHGNILRKSFGSFTHFGHTPHLSNGHNIMIPPMPNFIYKMEWTCFVESF